MRADHGSQSWRYPALLSYAQPDLIRRGSQEDILAGLRRLLYPTKEARFPLWCSCPGTVAVIPGSVVPDSCAHTRNGGACICDSGSLDDNEAGRPGTAGQHSSAANQTGPQRDFCGGAAAMPISGPRTSGVMPRWRTALCAGGTTEDVTAGETAVQPLMGGVPTTPALDTSPTSPRRRQSQAGDGFALHLGRRVATWWRGR